MPAPTLSIIVPAFNCAEFIEATLASCLEVSAPARELIVVDDGSTDSTRQICRKFGCDVRLICVENGGVSLARNIGAATAQGDWLLFLDSDDRLEPGGPSALIAAASGQHAAMAYGLVRERREPPLEPRITGQGHAAGNPPRPALRNYWRCAVITPGSAVIRRDLHERIGGFVPGYEPMEDRDYWIKAGLLEPCAHAESIVLDKTWRPVSAGKMNAKRIWNGLRSRLALPSWCAAHGVVLPREIPQQEQALLMAAVNEAVWCGCWDLVGALLRECRARGVGTLRTIRAALEFRLRGGEGRFPQPSWLIPLDG